MMASARLAHKHTAICGLCINYSKLALAALHMGMGATLGWPCQALLGGMRAFLWSETTLVNGTERLCANGFLLQRVPRSLRPRGLSLAACAIAA